jgi:hypothetical protein
MDPKQLEFLLEEQKRIAAEVENLYTNYKKSSLEKRGKLEYVNTQIIKICELFQQMAENHKILSTNEDKSLGYYTNKFFEKFSEYHEQSLAVLIRNQEEIERRIPSVDPNILPGNLAVTQQKQTLQLQTDELQQHQSPQMTLHPPNLPSQQNVPSINVQTQRSGNISPVQHFSHSSSEVYNESAVIEVTRLVRNQMSAFYILNAKMTKTTEALATLPIELVDINLNSISTQWDKIMELNRRIFGLAENPPGYSLEMYMEIEERVELMLAQLMNIKRKRSTSDLESSQNTSTAVHRSRSTVNDMIHLPKVQIPVFDGNVLSWNAFKNLFIQMIHNIDISETQKLFYLKSNLTGGAASMVTVMDMHLDTYQKAWERLCAKYDNNRLLTYACGQALFSANIERGDWRGIEVLERSYQGGYLKFKSHRN